MPYVFFILQAETAPQMDFRTGSQKGAWHCKMNFTFVFLDVMF